MSIPPLMLSAACVSLAADFCPTDYRPLSEDCHTNAPSELPQKDALPNKGNLVPKTRLSREENTTPEFRKAAQRIPQNPATDELRFNMQDASVTWEIVLGVCGA
jgi:hypothetical protein